MEATASDLEDLTDYTLRARLRSRIDKTPDPITGAPRIRVVIPDGSEPEIHDFSSFLHQPQIAEVITEGFRRWAKSVGPATRFETRGDLIRGLSVYLQGYPPNSVSPGSIDEGFWTGFLRFLDAPKESGQPWAVGTRAHRLGVVRSCLAALEHCADWNDVAKRLVYDTGLPSNPWPGRATKERPTEIILPHEVDRILTACLAEITAIRARVDQNATLLEMGHEELEAARKSGDEPDYALLHICAARVHEAFPDRLASLDDLQRLDPVLGTAVKRTHGMGAVRRILYNTFDDLVPFVILIGFKTVFNPDALLSLEWTAIQPSIDGTTLIFHVEKGRSTRIQTSTHDMDEAAAELSLPAENGTPLGLQDLLNILENLTTRTRAILADRDYVDRLFVGAPRWGGSVAKAFDTKRRSTDTAWGRPLKAFIDRNMLAQFTLSMIRATGADQTRRDFGLFAQQERLGHESPKTTRTFYTSDWVRKLGQDRIGEMQELYVRAAGSEGRIDPRGLGGNGEEAASTPGFMCLDPYHSPRSGQENGKLCTAYGECPSCPMVAAQPGNEEAVARYLALRNAIYAAQHGRVSASQWNEKWAPILLDLEALLKQVPKGLMDVAKRYRISLPPPG